jgi:hypothetical protein
MTSRRRNRALDTLAHRLDSAANIVPTVLAHLDEQRAQISTLSAPASGTKGSDVSDPTWRTMQQLSRLDNRAGRITDAIATLSVAVNMLDNACRDALGTRGHIEGPRCIGDGTPDGATCTQIADTRTDPTSGATIDDGRCIRCGPRHDATRRKESDARRLRRQRSTAA